MKLFHEHVYRLLALNVFLIFLVLLIFWPVWGAVKISLLYTLLMFLPALSIVQNFSLEWIEQFALAHVLGLTFPIIYALLNILGIPLFPVLYVVFPLLALAGGVWWHNKN